MKSKYIAPVAFALLIGAVVYGSIFWYTSHKASIQKQNTNAGNIIDVSIQCDAQPIKNPSGFIDHWHFSVTGSAVPPTPAPPLPINVKIHMPWGPFAVEGLSPVTTEYDSPGAIPPQNWTASAETFAQPGYAGSLTQCNFSTPQEEPPPPVTPPPPAPAVLVCAPATQSVVVGVSANFTASGGTGTYSWSAPNGSPASGSGTRFATVYNASGSKTVTVTSGSQTKTCAVTVTNPAPPPPNNPPPPPTLSCLPATQTVLTGASVTANASGGTGTYSWNAPGANPSTGSGAGFVTAYATTGNKIITVTSGSQSKECTVVVNAPNNPPPPPGLVCTPSSQNANVGASVTVSASGGTGSYSWSTSDATPTSGVGSSFTTAFNNSGTKTISVTSGSETKNCTVVVVAVSPPPGPPAPPAPNPPPPPVVCNPSNQYVTAGQQARFIATGGNGGYSWSAPTGSPTSGSGTAFQSTFSSVGSTKVTVTSNGTTSSCAVTVNAVQQAYVNLTLTKVVDKPQVTLGQQVVFTLTVGNTGTSTATDVSVQDILPPGLKFVSADPSSEYNTSTGIWNIGALVPNQIKTLSVTAKTTKSGTLVNIATIVSANVSAQAQVVVKEVLAPAGFPLWPYPVAGGLLALCAFLLRFSFAYSKVHVQKSGSVTVSSRDKYE